MEKNMENEMESRGTYGIMGIGRFPKLGYLIAGPCSQDSSILGFILGPPSLWQLPNTVDYIAKKW